MSKEFKVGDRVKLSNDINEIEGFSVAFAGRTGTITEVDNSSIPYHVYFDTDDGIYDDWGREGLSLIEPEIINIFTPATLQGKLDAIEKLVAEVRAMIG